MVTRTTPKATKTQTAQAAEKITPVVDTNDDEKSTMEMLRNFAANAGIEIPSGRRMLASSVTMLAVTALGAYSAASIASYIAVGAALLTGSAFIAFLLATIVGVISIYYTLITASKAAEYVGSGKLEEHCVAAKNWVTGLFAPKTVAEV